MPGQSPSYDSDSVGKARRGRRPGSPLGHRLQKILPQFRQRDIDAALQDTDGHVPDAVQRLLHLPSTAQDDRNKLKHRPAQVSANAAPHPLRRWTGHLPTQACARLSPRREEVHRLQPEAMKVRRRQETARLAQQEPDWMPQLPSRPKTARAWLAGPQEEDDAGRHPDFIAGRLQALNDISQRRKNSPSPSPTRSQASPRDARQEASPTRARRLQPKALHIRRWEQEEAAKKWQQEEAQAASPRWQAASPLAASPRAASPRAASPRAASPRQVQRLQPKFMKAQRGREANGVTTVTRRESSPGWETRTMTTVTGRESRSVWESTMEKAMEAAEDELRRQASPRSARIERRLWSPQNSASGAVLRRSSSPGSSGVTTVGKPKSARLFRTVRPEPAEAQKWVVRQDSEVDSWMVREMVSTDPYSSRVWESSTSTRSISRRLRPSSSMSPDAGPRPFAFRTSMSPDTGSPPFASYGFRQAWLQQAGEHLGPVGFQPRMKEPLTVRGPVKWTPCISRRFPKSATSPALAISNGSPEAEGAGEGQSAPTPSHSSAPASPVPRRQRHFTAKPAEAKQAAIEATEHSGKPRAVVGLKRIQSQRGTARAGEARLACLEGGIVKPPQVGEEGTTNSLLTVLFTSHESVEDFQLFWHLAEVVGESSGKRDSSGKREAVQIKQRERDEFYYAFCSSPERPYMLMHVGAEPGLMRHFIQGASVADALVITLPWRESLFRDDSWLMERALIARGMGINKLIFAVVEDEALLQTQFQKTVEFVKGQLMQHEITCTVTFIPIIKVSNPDGKGLQSPPWYRGNPLLESLDLIQAPFHSATSASLRVLLLDAHKEQEDVALVGRVMQGSIQPGSQCCLHPWRRELKVVKVFDAHTGEEVESVSNGDCAKFLVVPVAGEESARDDGGRLVKERPLLPARVASSALWDAQTVEAERWLIDLRVCDLRQFGSPDIGRTEISKDFRGTLYFGSQVLAVNIVDFIEAFDLESQKRTVAPRSAQPGAHTKCLVKLREPSAIDVFNGGRLGRFVLRRTGITLGVGRIIAPAAHGGSA